MAGRHFIWLLLFASALFLVGLTERHLWDADEPREAGITAEMARSADFVVPRLNGQAFLEKPPLYYWVGSAVFRLFGENTRSARIPSALAAIGGVLFVFILARKMGFFPLSAFVSALALATSAEYWSIGRSCGLDMMLCFFTTAAMLCFFETARLPKCRILWFAGYTLSLACAVLTKGLVGLAIPTSALTVWLLLSRKFSLRPWLLLFSGLILCLIPAAVWIWLLCGQLGSETVYKAVLANNFGRFTGAYAEHVEPFYYYLLKFPGQFFPWVLFIPMAWVFHVQEIRRRGKENPSAFIHVWFAVPFLLLSISAGKRGLYLLPLYPAAALFVGQAVGNVLEGKQPATEWFRVPAGIIAWAVTLTSLGFLAIAIYFKKPMMAWPLVSIPGFCLGLYAYRQLAANRLRGYLNAVVPALLVVYLTFDIAIAPISNSKKSCEPLFQCCIGLRSEGIEIGLVRPEERMMGAAVFYLGSRVLVFSEKREITDFLASGAKTAAIANKEYLKDLGDVDIVHESRISHDDIVVVRSGATDGE